MNDIHSILQNIFQEMKQNTISTYTNIRRTYAEVGKEWNKPRQIQRDKDTQSFTKCRKVVFYSCVTLCCHTLTQLGKKMYCRNINSPEEWGTTSSENTFVKRGKQHSGFAVNKTRVTADSTEGVVIVQYHQITVHFHFYSGIKLLNPRLFSLIQTL